eukprot:scaffold370850_cov40-Prasinocladus_malaysianus.AAC.1
MSCNQAALANELMCSGVFATALQVIFTLVQHFLRTYAGHSLETHQTSGAASAPTPQPSAATALCSPAHIQR